MSASLEFLLGLLDTPLPAFVATEDFSGPHGEELRRWQSLGFLRSEPGLHPSPSCPHCGEGSPYLLGGRYLCNRCYSTVDPRHLLVWPLAVAAFLKWLARQLGLQGGVRRLDPALWQLGRLVVGQDCRECFFRRRGPLSLVARSRLAAYRGVLLLYPLSPPPVEPEFSGTSISLLNVLRPGWPWTTVPASELLHRRGCIRFDVRGGTLWAGETWLGEVPVGSKEFYFLDCLMQSLDRFVAYAEIKHHVLQQSGSRDTTEEATFCQRLKNRIKVKGWVRVIDQLVVTTNKGDGYRLRAHLEP